MLLVACGTISSSSDSTSDTSVTTSTATSVTTSTATSTTSVNTSTGTSITSSSSAYDEAQEFIDIAYDSLGALFSDPTNIIAGFTVPSSLANGVSATWTSNLPGVIAFGQPSSGVVTAIVNRPNKDQGDATVTISATLSIQSSLTTQTLTRVWSITLTVKEKTVAELVVNTIADILAITDVQYDNTLNVTVGNITVVTVMGSDAFGYDGTGTIMLYQLTTPLVVGKVYTISGIIDWYFGMWEIKNITAIEEIASTPLTPTKEVVASVDEKISALKTAERHLHAFGTAASGNLEPIHATLTGKVHMIQGDTGNYNTWILDKDNTTGYVPGSGGENPVPANGFMVYYQTNNFNLIRQYEGIIVTIDVIIYTYRSNNNGFAIYYTGGENGITALLTDAQKQTLDANSLSLPSTILEATTLTLPTIGVNGSTIAWTSSDNTIINASTGEVVIPVSAQVVTLTASVTIAELEAITKPFAIVVGQLENTTLADFDTLAVATIGYSEAVVVWKNSNNRAAIVADATGFAYIFESAATPAVTALTVNQFVGLNYKVGAFRGLNQMTEVKVLSPKAAEAPTLPTPTTWSATEATTYATAAKIGVRYVTFENVYGYASGNFTNGYLPGFGLRQIQLNGADNGLRNTKFNVTGWLIGRNSDAPASTITIQGQTYSTPSASTDAEKLALAAERYVAPAPNAELTNNLTLPTTTTPAGTTIVANIAWTSSNPEVISTTGVVTRPASGSPDAEVTLSYVLSLGIESTTAKEIVFTVKAIVEVVNPSVATELFISEYIEGAPGNRKAIEIFNGTGATVTLTGVYTIKLGVNGAAWSATPIALSGTILTGQVFVLYYDDSSLNDKIGTFGNQESSSLSFNGDDAIGLFKNDVLIDIFGVQGVDPGTGWALNGTDNATVDSIIIRNANVISPSTTWIQSEWTRIGAYVDTTPLTTLGNHTFGS
jgi:hypothetical protein